MSSCTFSISSTSEEAFFFSPFQALRIYPAQQKRVKGVQQRGAVQRERENECASECERTGQRRRVAERTRTQVPKARVSAVAGPKGAGEARPERSGQRPEGLGVWVGGRGVSEVSGRGWSGGRAASVRGCAISVLSEVP